MKDKTINYQLIFRRASFVIYDVASVLAASFLAISMRYEFEFDMIPDYKTGAIGIRKYDEPPLLGDFAQQRQLLLILKQAEAFCFQNGGIHDLRQGIFIVAPLDQNRFFDMHHIISDGMSMNIMLKMIFFISFVVLVTMQRYLSFQKIIIFVRFLW